MRTEKQFLVEEVGHYLDKSDYALLAEYTRLTVAETRDLRLRLAKHSAEFHVVKNTILNKAASERNIPDMRAMLGGQLGIIVGGDAVSSIVKEAEKFFKEKDKGTIKGAILAKKLIPQERIEALRSLPTLEGARSQFLALLNTPASQLVRLLNAPAQQMLNVLDAKVRKENGDEAAA